MKASLKKLSAMAILPVAAFYIQSATVIAQEPQGGGNITVVTEPGVPGGITTNTLNISAKVVAVDPETRVVTLLGPMGKELQVQVKDDVENFDQIDVGDMVDATVTQQVVVAVVDAETQTADGVAGLVAKAPKGQKPGKISASTVQVTGTVTAIDTENRTATLKFDDGTSETFPVRPDIDLTKYGAGDKVVFQMTRMTAIEVSEPDEIPDEKTE